MKQILIGIAVVFMTTTTWAADENDEQTFETVFATHKGKLGYDRFKVQFLEAIEKYDKQRRDKALAVARDIGGRWAYGTSQDERNKSDARQTAMRYCKKYRKEFAISASCQIYKVNSKVVLEKY